MDPDRELVERARAGSQEAFADLVCRYQDRVVNLARSLTASDADADDLAQDVFVRVFTGLGGFRGESAFRTWLYRIAVNVVRSHQRRQAWLGMLQRQQAVTADDPLENVPAPGDVEAAAVRRDAIDRALRRLPVNLRMAVTLRDVQGLEYREIAEVTRVPVGTVMSRIARGRAKLRPMLGELLGRAADLTRSVGSEARDADL